MPDGSSRTDRSGEPSAIAATLAELSPGQAQLKEALPKPHHLYHSMLQTSYVFLHLHQKVRVKVFQVPSFFLSPEFEHRNAFYRHFMDLFVWKKHKILNIKHDFGKDMYNPHLGWCDIIITTSQSINHSLTYLWYFDQIQNFEMGCAKLAEVLHKLKHTWLKEVVKDVSGN